MKRESKVKAQKECYLRKGYNQAIGVPVGSQASGWWHQEGKLPEESRSQARSQRMVGVR